MAGGGRDDAGSYAEKRLERAANHFVDGMLRVGDAVEAAVGAAFFSGKKYETTPFQGVASEGPRVPINSILRHEVGVPKGVVRDYGTFSPR